MNKYYDIQKRLETYFQELTDTSWLLNGSIESLLSWIELTFIRIIFIKH